MLFVIQPSAMDGAESVLNALDSILNRVEDNVHNLEIADAERLETTSWFRQSRSGRKEMLEEIAQVSAWRSRRERGPHLRRVDVNDEISAVTAQPMAYTSLRVLLENAGSDGALVGAALRTFGSQDTLELCFGDPSRLDPPAITMDNAGGSGELKKLLEKRLKDASDRKRSPRLIVIADSDGEWVGDVKECAKEIRRMCEERNVPCPPLNKRTAENYIPDAVWMAWSEDRNNTSKRPVVAELLKLSPDQRDYVRIGDGNSAPWDETNPKAVELFSDVSTEAFALLKQASLKGRGEHMMIFALDEHQAVLTPATFNSRDPQGDLLSIVRAIEDEL